MVDTNEFLKQLQTITGRGHRQEDPKLPKAKPKYINLGNAQMPNIGGGTGGGGLPSILGGTITQGMGGGNGLRNIDESPIRNNEKTINDLLNILAKYRASQIVRRL